MVEAERVFQSTTPPEGPPEGPPEDPPDEPLADGNVLPSETGIRKGLERAVLTTWITEFHAPLYRYAYRLAGGQAEAEDLTQQTFLIALEQGGSVRDPQRILAWLFCVLRNCYLKDRRRKSLTPLAESELTLDQIPAFAGPDRWEGHDLQEALNALPDDYKIVVLMFYFEDASYKQIAERLQIPLGTVMSRLSRAKGQLRALLLDASEVDSPPPNPCTSPPTQ